MFCSKKVHILKDATGLTEFFTPENLLVEHGGTSKVELPPLPNFDEIAAEPDDGTDAGFMPRSDIE